MRGTVGRPAPFGSAGSGRPAAGDPAPAGRRPRMHPGRGRPGGSAASPASTTRRWTVTRCGSRTWRPASSTAPVTLPVVGDIAAGSTTGITIQPGFCARIMTGAPIPPGADAVVQLEWTDGGTSSVVISQAPRLGHHIRHAGEDLAAGDLVLPQGSYPRRGPDRTARRDGARVGDVPSASARGGRVHRHRSWSTSARLLGAGPAAGFQQPHARRRLPGGRRDGVPGRAGARTIPRSCWRRSRTT